MTMGMKSLCDCLWIRRDVARVQLSSVTQNQLFGLEGSSDPVRWVGVSGVPLRRAHRQASGQEERKKRTLKVSVRRRRHCHPAAGFDVKDACDASSCQEFYLRIHLPYQLASTKSSCCCGGVIVLS